MDIGDFNKRALLTGAGWSRNWGGRLATEVWEDLLGNSAIQSNDRLRALLLNEQSFEVALAMTQQTPFMANDYQVFQQALRDTFIAMDHEIARTGRDPWINIYNVQKLLSRFPYFFTLNQDLWPERHLYNTGIRPSLPGISSQPNEQLFSSICPPYSRGLVMQPINDPATQGRLRGTLNVIKLHGSFNWQTADGSHTLVVGTKKSSQITESPLLTWYFDIFKQVLSAGNVRLMIVGYGFGDEHVNEVIASAIKHHGLKVFIWDTRPNLKDHILASSHGASIWSGLLSIASRSFIEIFPSDQAETQEYLRIQRTLFD